MKAIKDRRTLQRIKTDFNIGNGEAETLAFALTQKNALVAIDDRRGIKGCKLLKLSFVTAIDIIVRFNENKILSNEQAVSKLEALAVYGRYSNAIIANAKMRLEATQ